jgi:hypothetical protein
MDYRTYLANCTKLGTNTIKTYIVRVCTFYRHFGIQLPELPPLKLDTEYVSNYFDLPTKEHIRKALEISDLDMQSVILFMSSSGTAKAETLSLTVKQFIKGCKGYYTIGNSLEDILLELSQRDDVVPIIYLRRIKTDKYYYTCCSPEAVKSICKYLLTRFNLKLEDKVFDFSNSLLLVKFQEINDYYDWGFVGKYRFFRAHTLRKFHASNIGLPKEQVDMFQGRSKDVVHETYIKEDPEKLRRLYSGVMDNVRLIEEETMVESEEDNLSVIDNVNFSGANDGGVNLSFNVNITSEQLVDILKYLNK